MRKNLFFIPECFVDTNLIKTLLNVNDVNHQMGCNHVCKVMKEKFDDNFAVGIIDYDKKRPKYVDEFDEIASSEHLTLLKHSNKPHYIIFVKPAVEGFILSCVENLGVNMNDYDLSGDIEGLKKITKNVNSDRDPRFKKLFHSLEYGTEMSVLKNVLNHLKDNIYKSDAEVLKRFFDNK